jgi:glycosyltransferase involved in cell wall biosynthesis
MNHPRNQPSSYENYFVSQVNFWGELDLLSRMRAAGRVLYSIEAKRRIRRLIEDTEPDIAHVQLIYHQISPAILPVIKDHRIPIIQTLHDYKPICPTYSLVANNRICECCKGKKFYHAAFRRCNHGSFLASLLSSFEMYLHHSLGWYDLPDLYIAPSKFLELKMIEFGMPSTKLKHIPNFIDTHHFTYSTDRQEYFTYIGRLEPVKGVETLLRAMTHLRSLTIKLLVIGEGSQRVKLEMMKRRLNLDNVEFLGYQSGNRLKGLMSNSLFSVMPSEWYENCPLSVLESMAMGVPVIGARIGGIPELINHEEDGLLFESGNSDDLANKIRILADGPVTCLKMGRTSREKMVRKYNPEIHYQLLYDVYKCLIE